MKNILCFFFLVVLTLPAHAEVKIEYRVSRVHGLFNFVQAVTGQPHQSPGLKEIFEKSAYNKADLQNQIALYKGLQKNLENPVTVPTEYLIPGRYPARPVSDLILTQAVFAKDLADLSQRTLGLLPLKVHDQFFSILKKFEPAYKDLIWDKSSAELLKHKTELEKLAAEVNLNAMFGKVALFYRANWPEELPFTVGLYPIPWIEGFKNSANSHSVGTVEDHGVMMGMKKSDAIHSLAVIFHEICHSLYDSQSAEYMKNLSSYFTESKSLYRDSAYKWFNEAVATSIGNGWVETTLNKGVKNEFWYNDTTIDGYAKQIYPLTVEYLTQGRSMDRNFVEQSILNFGKKFPEAIYLYQDQFQHLTFIHGGSFIKSSEARDLFRSRFDISGYTGSSPIDHPQTIQSATDDQGTLFVVFNTAELKSLEQLIAGVPFLKKNMLSLITLKNRTYFSALDEKARTYVVVRAESKQEFTAAVDRMKVVRKIDPQYPIQSF
ncbi:hypothetical protein [Bdellovibrio sp. HCB2-146]|uniref:hypothetical protein n=1 Tax=Bdellovibrio sp. HCB2-146 TaxID=3394362 RepID=UPI0039BD8973